MSLLNKTEINEKPLLISHDILSKTIASIGFFANMGLGIPLWFALIHFEKFGGDPMKRSISNMFTAYLGYVVIFTSFVCPLIKYSRVMIGCLPFEVGMIFVFVRQFACYMVAYLFSLIMMYKCLRLYKFHLTAWFIDDFLGPFMVDMLIFLNILLIIIKYHLGLMNNVTLKLLTCLDIDVIGFKDDM